MENHKTFTTKDAFLTKLRWETATKEDARMTYFATDCFCYMFYRPLSFEEQNDFLDFIGDADNLNKITPVDFCDYYLFKNIPFEIKYKYTKEIGLWANIESYRLIKLLQKILKKIRKEKEKYEKQKGN